MRCVGCCDWVLIVWMGGTQGAAGGARCTRREVPVARVSRRFFFVEREAKISNHANQATKQTLTDKNRHPRMLCVCALHLCWCLWVVGKEGRPPHDARSRVQMRHPFFGSMHAICNSSKPSRHHTHYPPPATHHPYTHAHTGSSSKTWDRRQRESLSSPLHST